MDRKRHTITFHPRPEMKGLKYGIQFENKPEIYVSPAIYSLSKTDFNALLDTLRIKVIKETSPDNPLLKKRGVQTVFQK